MRTFEHFNASHGAICPVCKTAKDCETVLVAVPGTEDDGLCEARQVHKKCYDLVVEMGDDVWPNDLLAAKVDDRVRFEEEKQAYTIQARGDRYLVLTKPFNARRTVLYTVVDLVECVRGTENLIFGAGAETREQCREMLMRLEGRDDMWWATEVSHRNRIPLKVRCVLAAS